MSKKQKSFWIKRCLLLKRRLARRYSLKKIKHHDFTIISDNCWAREVYKFLDLPHRTPTIGLGMRDSDYLSFIENLHQEDAAQLKELDKSHCNKVHNKIYPVGKTPYAKVHFLHYNEFKVAQRMFQMGFRKINKERLFYKIDFDFKKADVVKEIEHWNQMKLPNSIAFYSDETLKKYSGPVHNGVYIENKSKQKNDYSFCFFQKYFDYIYWLNHGRIRRTWKYRFLNAVLLDDRINFHIDKWYKLLRYRKRSPSEASA